jgi:hypothetical protein
MPFDPANVRVLPPSLREPSHTVDLPPVPPERGGGGPRRVHIVIEIVDRRQPQRRRSSIGTFAVMLFALIVALALFGCAAHAQPSQWESYRQGSTTYYSGTDAKGGQWSGRSYDLGDTTYFDADGPNGQRQHCESYTLGGMRYTRCN